MALAHGREIQLGPGQEHQIGQAEIRQGRHDVVRVRQVEDERPKQNAEDDLDHDLGYGDERRDHSATMGARTAASPMRTRVGIALSIMCRLFALDRPLWHAAPPPRHTLRARWQPSGDLEGLTGRGR